MIKKPKLPLCQNPQSFTKEDLHSIRDIAIKNYHQIPPFDGWTRKSHEELQAESWGNAVVSFLKHHGWEITRKGET